MRKTICILTMFLCSCSSSTSISNENQQVTMVIASCIEKYRAITNELESPKIDRVYVVSLNNLVNVLFTHGAMGTFNERSKDYRSDFYCGAKLSPKITVLNILNDRYENLYHYNSFDLAKLDFDYNKSMEYLFMKKGNEFVFYAKQPFDDSRLK